MDLLIKTPIYNYFENIVNNIFNKNEILGDIVISDVNFGKCIFKSCVFKNIIFKNCTFEYIGLVDTDFQNVHFNKCNI